MLEWLLISIIIPIIAFLAERAAFIINSEGNKQEAIIQHIRILKGNLTKILF